MLLFKFTNHDFNILKKSLEVKVETDLFFHIVQYFWVIIKTEKVGRDWDVVVSSVAD